MLLHDAVVLRGRYRDLPRGRVGQHRPPARVCARIVRERVVHAHGLPRPARRGHKGRHHVHGRGGKLATVIIAQACPRAAVPRHKPAHVLCNEDVNLAASGHPRGDPGIGVQRRGRPAVGGGGRPAAVAALQHGAAVHAHVDVVKAHALLATPCQHVRGGHRQRRRRRRRHRGHAEARRRGAARRCKAPLNHAGRRRARVKKAVPTAARKRPGGNLAARSKMGGAKGAGARFLTIPRDAARMVRKHATRKVPGLGRGAGARLQRERRGGASGRVVRDACPAVRHRAADKGKTCLQRVRGVAQGVKKGSGCHFSCVSFSV